MLRRIHEPKRVIFGRAAADVFGVNNPELKKRQRE